MLRTVQLVGGAYSLDNNLSALVKINNNVVYSGALSNVENIALPESGFSKTDVLATWDYDFGYVYGVTQPDDAKINLSIEVSGGDSFSGISFVSLKINWHCPPFIDIANKKYYTTGPDVFWYPGRINYQTDGKSNIHINGIDQMWQRTDDKIGIYHWPVSSGSTLTCQVDVRATITPDSSYTMELMSEDNVSERLALPLDITEAYTYIKEYHDECKTANRCLARDHGKDSDCPSIGLCCRAILPFN